jgi:hypothetical protein
MAIPLDRDGNGVAGNRFGVTGGTKRPMDGG